MTLSDLWTPKVRRATGELSLALLKITGKVAVAGTASLAGALAGAAVSSTTDSSEQEDKPFTELKDGPEGHGYYQGGMKVED